MANAIENLNWIDSITTPQRKWEQLPEEEKMNVFPTGVLKEVQMPEYCESYELIKQAAQGKRAKLTQDDFEKKI